MLRSKLFEYLDLLTPYEVNQLRKLVYSPWFNKHENTRKLFDYVVEVRGDGKPEDEELLTKEAAHRFLFPGEDYDVQKVKDIMSPLTKLVETYLAQLSYNEDDNTQTIYLLKQLEQRRADKLFEFVEKRVRKQLQKEQPQDEEFFYYNYRFESEADRHFMASLARQRHESLQSKADNLDHYYMLVKLKTCCEMINRSNIIKVSYEMPFLESLKEYITENLDRFKDFHYIISYYYILLALQDPEQEEHYDRLINYLNDNSGELDPDEARSMYEYAKNYCIKKINSGQSDYLNRLFEVYKSLIENRLIFQGNVISHWDYKNIVTVATRLKEYDYCYRFIEEQRDNLTPDQRENAYTYNLATYYYARQQYQQTMELLRDVEFTDVYYGIGGRTLLLKTYYEMNEMEAFFSMVDSFRLYLRRNKLISEYQHKVNSNLIRFTKKLAKLKYDRSMMSEKRFTKELKDLKAKVDTTREISNIGWLKEKIEELMPDEVAEES